MAEDRYGVDGQMARELLAAAEGLPVPTDTEAVQASVRDGRAVLSMSAVVSEKLIARLDPDRNDPDIKAVYEGLQAQRRIIGRPAVPTETAVPTDEDTPS